MLEHFPTTEDFVATRRMRRNLIVAILAATVIFVVGTMTAVSVLVEKLPPEKIVLATLSALTCMLIPLLVCYKPRIGLYCLFVGALLFPWTHDVGLATMPTTFIPFWWNLSTVGQANLNNGALNGLAISPAEIIMVLTFVVWLVRAIALRELRLKAGTFFWVIAAYMFMVVVGFVNGMAQHGDATMALYEIRGQAYFFLAYIMAVNIIEDKRQLTTLLWTIVICNGIQGFFGTITFFSRRSAITESGYIAHDESLILNLVFFVAIMAGTLGNDRRLMWTAIFVSPLALIAILGNQRRASIAAFIIAFIPLIPILWVIVKEKRQQIGAFALLFAVCIAVYMPLAWGATGAWALPARAIRSTTDPDARDAASNTYRDSENWDIIVTRDQSPIIGYGYGRRFLQPVPLPHVTTDFVHYMPHNSILWVWMRLGHIGFFLFWMMVATFIIRGLEIIREMRDVNGRLVGLIAISMLLMMLTFGKYDLALVDLRVLTITAILLGALAKIPELERDSRRPELADATENQETIDESGAPLRLRESVPMEL